MKVQSMLLTPWQSSKDQTFVSGNTDQMKIKCPYKKVRFTIGLGHELILMMAGKKGKWTRKGKKIPLVQRTKSDVSKCSRRERTFEFA